MNKPNFTSIFQKISGLSGKCKELLVPAEPKPEDFEAPGTSMAVDAGIDRFFAVFGALAGLPARVRRIVRRAARRTDKRLIFVRNYAERTLSSAARRAGAFARARALSLAAPPANGLRSAARVLSHALRPAARALRAAASRLFAAARFVCGAGVCKVSALFLAAAEASFASFARAVERENKVALFALRFMKSVWLHGKRLRARARKARAFLALRLAAIDAAVMAASDRTWTATAAAASRCAAVLLAFARALRHAWRWVCVFSDVHKRGLLTASAVCLVFAICAVSAVNKSSVYAYMYNGKVLGVVNDKETVYSAVRLVGGKLSQAYDAEIDIDENRDISFERVFGNKLPVDSPDDVLNNLTYMKDMKVKGYTLVADGKAIATFDSETTARGFLKDVQDQFLVDTGGRENYTRVGFAENIHISETDTKLAYLKKPEDVFDYVMTGAVEQRYHSVEKGQTLSGIAQIYSLGLSELMNMNPGVVPERLQIGQQLKLERIVPLLTVQTTEVATYIEEIPFEIAYEDNASMFKGEQTVRLAGTKGERQVTAEIIRENGIETGKNELESVTLSEPTAQVVLVGTKDPPPLIGTGSFQYPTRGRLTSRFGTRWGRMHSGIDLAAATGTSIRAADGGKVTFAGRQGSLGYLVKIDHGGNRETWYGHCSKLFVKAGDKVYQGQHIANVGNTGNSTGPHLHFEVHINGVAKNPLNYL
ncbi:MAG: M23 family metallopeptidase [Clostridiales Family XIII bacterium]|jgi:murein DD-endopeptidase MepM/ murein hydrolase activator NlpD|nr:M23 family metallopeptidase [Clostridiales Family XIII bacterium]